MITFRAGKIYETTETIKTNEFRFSYLKVKRVEGESTAVDTTILREAERGMFAIEKLIKLIIRNYYFNCLVKMKFIFIFYVGAHRTPFAIMRKANIMRIIIL